MSSTNGLEYKDGIVAIYPPSCSGNGTVHQEREPLSALRYFVASSFLMLEC